MSAKGRRGAAWLWRGGWLPQNTLPHPSSRRAGSCSRTPSSLRSSWSSSWAQRQRSAAGTQGGSSMRLVPAGNSAPALPHLLGGLAVLGLASAALLLGLAFGQALLCVLAQGLAIFSRRGSRAGRLALCGEWWRQSSCAWREADNSRTGRSDRKGHAVIQDEGRHGDWGEGAGRAMRHINGPAWRVTAVGRSVLLWSGTWSG